MDTGVDPAGVKARAGGRRKKKQDMKFASRSSSCLMAGVTGTQFGDSFCGSKKKRDRVWAGCRVDNACFELLRGLCE